MALPVTTIPPFADQGKLPPCAVSCGPLYDANGACVPTTLPLGDPASYTACFCSHGAVAPFSTAATGVCAPNVCDPQGLTSVMNWFQDICSVQGKDQNNGGSGGNGGNNDGSGGNGQGDSNQGSGNSGSGNRPVPVDNGGGSWLSNHWQWVIMLVVLVVAIAGIWIGACIWRRRYIRKKDRQSTLPQKQSGSPAHPSWGPDTASPNIENGASGPGVFMPGAAAAASASPAPDEKTKGKKKWTVSERT